MVRITACESIWRPLGAALARKWVGVYFPFTDAIERLCAARPKSVDLPIGEAKPLLDWLTSEFPKSVTWEVLP